MKIDGIIAIDISPLEEEIAIASRNKITLYDLKNFKEINTINSQNDIISLKF